MFEVNHRLEAATAAAPTPPAEPFISFDVLFACLRELGADDHRGRLLWRHALETAELARLAEGGDALVSAALLHHVGRMILGAGGATTTEVSASALSHFGADLLTELYAPPVTEPIRLQASARRYLAGSRSSNLRQLLHVGGAHVAPVVMPMTEIERECFATMPFAGDAIRLCRWSLAATGAGDVERHAVTLRRIAARSVCNDGFGWESSRRADGSGRVDVIAQVPIEVAAGPRGWASQ